MTETVEVGGRSRRPPSGYAVYRLYHQEFARHLSEEAGVEPTQAAITRALLAHVQVAPDGRRDWRNAPLYLRAHLAAHAAAGAVLDEFLVDPGYLYHAQPDRLLNVLSAARSTEARCAATAYRLAARRLDAQPGSLGLAAAQVGAATLMANLQTLEHGSQTSWIALWAWSRRPTPTQFITALPTGQRVRLTLCATARGPAAVIAYGTTIEAWDLDTGTLLDRVIQDNVVNCLTTVASPRGDVLLIGGESGSLQLRTLPDLALIADRRGAHVTEVHVGCPLDSLGIVATGDIHGHLALWSATDLEPRAVRENAHTLVKSLAFIRVDGEDVLLSAGDNFPVDDGGPGGMPSLRAWSLPRLDLLAEADRNRKLANWMGVLQDRDSTLIFIRTADDSEVWRMPTSGGPLRLIDQFRGSPIALLMTAPGQALLPSWYELAPIRVRADRVEVGELIDCEPAGVGRPD